MNHYQTLLEDLSNTLLFEINEYSAPYEEWLPFEEKFKLTKRALSRAKGMSNRILQLTNAFFLGRLLELETESDEQRERYYWQLTVHFRTITKRMYYIFEFARVKQIMRTTGTTMSTIRLIIAEEYEDLIFIASNIFNRAENLGGE